MEQGRVAIVGFGDLGERLAPRLRAAGWGCLGLRRRVQQLPDSVTPVAVDLSRPETLSVLREIAPERLVFTPTPAGRDVDGYRRGFAEATRHLLAGLGGHCPARALFVSSTRVYAETDGGWVDEDSALSDSDPGALAIIEGERAFLEALPGGLVLRAGGLYGLGPGYLLRKVAAGQLRPAEPVHYSNRLHRDDFATVLAACLALEVRDPPPPQDRVINAVDDLPAPLHEVECWLCEQLGRDCSPPQARGEVGAHKRVRNSRLRAAGIELRYPDYRAGYAEVLRRWLAHSEREDGLDLH